MQPLEGIKVLDLSRLAPGPFATMIMGDLGVDVLMIEAPAGATSEIHRPWADADEYPDRSGSHEVQGRRIRRTSTNDDR